jgi:hypothetical protein
MAGQGRCAGCGKTGNAARIDRHSLDCGKFQALYTQGSGVLTAQAEYTRWAVHDKAAGRLERRDTALASASGARARQNARFAQLPDILADEPPQEDA